VTLRDSAVARTMEATPGEGMRGARMIRCVGASRVFFGSDMPVGGNPPPKESWALTTSRRALSRRAARAGPA